MRTQAQRDAEREEIAAEIDAQKKDPPPGFVMVGAAVCVVAAWFVMWGISSAIYPSAPGDRNGFGDSFGFANSLFSGLAFAGVIVTIWIQGKELKSQRLELRATRIELEESGIAQKATADAQRRLVEATEKTYLLGLQPALNPQPMPNSPSPAMPQGREIKNVGRGPAINVVAEVVAQLWDVEDIMSPTHLSTREDGFSRLLNCPSGEIISALSEQISFEFDNEASDLVDSGLEESNGLVVSPIKVVAVIHRIVYSDILGNRFATMFVDQKKDATRILRLGNESDGRDNLEFLDMTEEELIEFADKGLRS